MVSCTHQCRNITLEEHDERLHLVYCPRERPPPKRSGRINAMKWLLQRMFTPSTQSFQFMIADKLVCERFWIRAHSIGIDRIPPSAYKRLNIRIKLKHFCYNFKCQFRTRPNCASGTTLHGTSCDLMWLRTIRCTSHDSFAPLQWSL